MPVPGSRFPGAPLLAPYLALRRPCVALAALPAPVVITTAGGVEPQAFVLVYYLGAGLAVDGLARAAAAASGRG